MHLNQDGLLVNLMITFPFYRNLTQGSSTKLLKLAYSFVQLSGHDDEQNTRFLTAIPIQLPTAAETTRGSRGKLTLLVICSRVLPEKT